MPDFPLLSTGAVMQYPARRTASFVTRVVRFLDGSEQRFKVWPAPLLSWVIRLDLLTEEELNALREFFRERTGRAQDFRFVDPWDESVHEHCTFDSDQFEVTLLGEGNGESKFVIRQSR